ncbi:FMN reductase [NAD(P)H] [Oxobacter pfennigii]|uniref:FMN reductase [NAD(P)H] n=1 Tax=Oxobacter pfennigii TaxID=36849 RepID=A0A0P9AEV1_9CLOT|nr:nitroreductase [Oxobacter pfennigii]KPU43854.1 FMN reductase [NAD(P)H] [Oxobacter pfennigii]
MNETIKTLLNRRSVKKYKPEQIKDEDLNTILEAAKFSPSGGNRQPVLYIVVQNPEMRQRVVDLNAAVMGKTGIDPYYGAPTIVLVLADKTSVTPVEDASIVIGNMLNAAYSLGLGSCWIHRTKQMFESEAGIALLKELGVEGEYIGVGSCILGYPDGDLPKAAPRKEGNVIIVK